MAPARALALRGAPAESASLCRSFRLLGPSKWTRRKRVDVTQVKHDVVQERFHWRAPAVEPVDRILEAVEPFVVRGYTNGFLSSSLLNRRNVPLDQIIDDQLQIWKSLFDHLTNRSSETILPPQGSDVGVRLQEIRRVLLRACDVEVMSPETRVGDVGVGIPEINL